MPRKFQSFAEQFHLREASLWQRLGRDVRLFRWMIQTIRMWWKARPVRAEFERCRANGQAFYVDRFAGPPAAPQPDLATSPEVSEPRNPDTSTDQTPTRP